MRTNKERAVFLTSAVLSGFATIALAAAATATAPVAGSHGRPHARDWSDTFCTPDTCTSVAKTPVRGLY